MKNALRFNLLLILFFSFIFAQKELKLIEELKNVGQWKFNNFVITLNFEQPVDHNNPDGEKFTQRVFIKHVGFNKPVVLHNRGYYAYGRGATELTRLLNCNEIEVEHRYFPPSIPNKINWKYLTVEQESADLHAVVMFLKKYYTGKWINTGVSKGGQTSLFYRYHYPNDVDVTVAYVAPVNKEIEDHRISPFIEDSISTPEARKKIHDLQIAFLDRHDELIPMVKEDLRKKNDKINGDFNIAYEHAVLEFSFAWWQYKNGDYKSLPNPDASTKELYKVFKGSLDFFGKKSVDRLKAFNYQAYTQMGFYGYNTESFKGHLKYVKGDFASNMQFFIQKDWDIHFDDKAVKGLANWIANDAENVICIYGGFDPWSATRAKFSGKTNSFAVLMPGGNHSTNIASLDKERQEKVLFALEKWLNVKIDRRRLKRRR